MKNQTFSDFLIRKRNEINLNNSKLASNANISAVYLGEIINNKKSPPDKKTQYALANALHLTKEEEVLFYNLAANERGEIPVDIYDYLLTSEDLLNEIRAIKQKGERDDFKENN